MFTVSINPTYYCNFRCNFCYLTEEQLSDRAKIKLEVLEDRIKEVQSVYTVDMVDLYGGEIGLLPESYVSELCDMLRRNSIDDINIITNLSMVNDVIRHPDLYTTVSYDFECREQHERVWNNMFKLEKPFSILILAGPELIKKDVDDMILQLNLLANLESVEIKPYSTNQANSHRITFKDFEKFVIKWLESDMPKNFQFVNEENIKNSLNGLRNAFSNDHVYITPSGKFGVLEFDRYDREYFLELDSIQEYVDWAANEPHKNVSQICKTCEYYGKCLTEHYRYVRHLEHGCNGFRGLLDYARLEN